METIQIPALGRLFRLGMFYDSRRDQLLTDKIFWHHDELKDHILIEAKPESEFAFTAEDSISEKTSFLDINTELKLSLMCGFVKVRGAAEYLEDRKQFTQQSRVSFKYRCTTHFEELLLDSLLKTSKKRFLNFTKNKATHIVVGILYGIESIFLFDKTYSDDKNVNEFNINLEAQVVCLPKMSLGTGCTTNETHAVVRDVLCTFYGDITLDKNPTTFEEAVKVFKILPSIIGENGQAPVPLTVWLYPLSKLSPHAPRTLDKVNIVMINEIEEQLENLAIHRMKCNDLLAKLACTYVEDMRKKVENLKKDIYDSEKKLADKLSEIVPGVRQSFAGNEQLYNIVEEQKKSTDKINSLYSSYHQTEKTLTAVINNLQRVPRSLVLHGQMSETYKGKEENEPIVHIQIPDSFKKPEKVLKEIKPLLKDTVKLLDKNADSFSKEISLKMTVSSDHNDIQVFAENLGAGVTVLDPPGKPFKVASSAHSIDIACNQPTTDIQPFTEYLVSFTIVGREEWHFQKFENIEYMIFRIYNLSADTGYIFRLKCHDSSGINASLYSDTSDPIFTKPSLGGTILKEAEIIKRGRTSVFRFPVKIEVQNDEDKIIRYSSDHHCPRGNLFDERVILIFGNSDCNIQELLDGMVNYIADVDISDSFRYSFGHLEKDEYVKVFRIPHSVGSRIEYTLTLIDFSAIIDYNRKDIQLQVQQHIERLVESSYGCMLVHGIIIVIPAKLDADEKCKYQSTFTDAVSVLGPTIESNVIYMITGDEINYFDDFDIPVVCQFETSILFKDTVDSDQQSRWVKLMDNFKALFQHLGKLDPKSLKLESVLKDIKASEFLIPHLQSNVQVCLSELHASKQEFQTLEAHKEDISQNIPFSYEVTEIRIRHEYRDDKQPSTYCLSCKVVCHENCVIVVDSEKSGCAVMGEDGKCTVCPDHCSWQSHINPAYRSVPEIVKVTKLSTINLKELDTLEVEITNKRHTTVSTILTTTNEINKMREDSKSVDGKMSVQYFIDHMISVEEHDQFPGYEERIEELELLRECPDIMEKVAHKE